MLIKGKFIYLKKISLNDDKFIYYLRNKKSISNYLHSPPKSIHDQKKWILNNIPHPSPDVPSAPTAPL